MAVHISGLRIEAVGILAACTRLLTFSQHEPVPAHSCSFSVPRFHGVPSQMPPHVKSDAYCRKTVLTCAHTLGTRRDPKPHRTHCALFHQTAATATAAAAAANRQKQSCRSMCREHTRRALCNHTSRYPIPKTKDLDAQQSIPHHLPHSQTRPRTT